jgi:proline iminopeptidase
VSWLRLVGRGLGIAAAVLLGLVAGAATLLGAAALTDRLALFTLAGLAATAITTAAGVAVALWGRSTSRDRHQRVAIPTGMALVASSIAALALLWPLGDLDQPPAAVAGQTMWALPTGSRLAVVHVSAVGRPSATPIVYLHGGPGISELPEATAAFGRLAADGFDVYLYDQIGVGRSQRLSDPTGYTMERDIADLEAVRARIGAARMVLIGHSWGATLAAAYLARYPEHVARVVFSSPGALALAEYGALGAGIVDRLAPTERARLNVLLSQPRALAAWALAQVNPRAAHAFAGDRELDARYDRVYAASAPGLFCDPSLAARVDARGEGFYANQVTLADATAPDPRLALRQSDVPALILKPGCDYLPWRLAIEYRQTLPHAVMVLLPDAGHQAYLEQPDAYFAAVRAFLLGQPPPVPPYEADAPPADYRGAR